MPYAVRRLLVLPLMLVLAAVIFALLPVVGVVQAVVALGVVGRPPVSLAGPAGCGCSPLFTARVNACACWPACCCGWPARCRAGATGTGGRRATSRC